MAITSTEQHRHPSLRGHRIMTIINLRELSRLPMVEVGNSCLAFSSCNCIFSRPMTSPIIAVSILQQRLER